MVPYLFSSTAPTAEVTDALGWQSVQVAEDNLIDLGPLEFKGKSWQDVRTALNRATKEGITFRMVTLADESWALVRQVEKLSQEWLGDKGLPEMGFTLGGVPEALDPATKVGLALDTEGQVQGVTSWMPVYPGQGEIAGWTLDLMRRKDGGFKSVMEFLDRLVLPAFQGRGRAVRLAVRCAVGPLGGRGRRHRDREVPRHPGRAWSRSTASVRCTRSRASSSRVGNRCT